MKGNVVIDRLPNWDAAVWINIATSVCVGMCVLTWLIFGWIRRNRLSRIQDGERWAITSVLVGLLAFFASRAIDVARAGMTIATPWLLTCGVALSIASVVCTVIICRKHDDYGVLRQREWTAGDRRSGPRRQADIDMCAEVERLRERCAGIMEAEKTT